ncbi:alanyl-tRNA editing protein [bacterium 1XD42-1]|nr:alanyl-tRNA editing protein [bacterium 1XD42-8]RKJ67590.1 alanyl-tRNA editing protein [bacterium 1XD42-1]
MTQKLFYENMYLQHFSATVTGCESAQDRWHITLDATAFYPEGGGQPGDTGYLGNVRVIDTHSRRDEVIHITDGPIQPGEKIEGKIDWEPRFSRMQHHTGEHIVSGLIHRLYGYDNVGFHMGHDAVTLDLSGELSGADLEKVERLANEAVWKNIPIEISYPSPEALAALDYRSKKELSGDVRIVTVPEYDICACCGTHVHKTGEIGLIKLVNFQRYKGGIRIWMLCGGEALEDYTRKNKDVFAVSALLSAKPHEITPALEHVLKERDGLKLELGLLQDRLFEYKAAAIEQGSFTIQFEENLSPNELRKYCLALCERCETAAVFSGKDREWKYAIGSKNQDVRVLGKAFNGAFSGKGGGKPGLIQGSVTGDPEAIKQFFQHP